MREMHGRRTGRPISFPVMVADCERERYLVSMLGERANWVANVRAASDRPSPPQEARTRTARRGRR